MHSITAANLDNVLSCAFDDAEKNGIAVFDFSSLRYIGITEGVALALAAASLRGSGHDVAVSYQTFAGLDDPTARARLDCYRFMVDLGITAAVDDAAGRVELDTIQLVRCMDRFYPKGDFDYTGVAAKLPLQDFVGERSVRRACGFLRSEGVQASLGASYRKSQLAESDLLASTIVTELGQNIYQHAFHGELAEAGFGSGWRRGFLAFHGGLKVTEQYRRAAASWQDGWLNEMRGRQILKVVVGDNGLGIQRTLRDAYERAHAAHGNCADLDFGSSVDVLLWAFDERSTRRPGSRDSASWAGLAKVRASMREHGGLLSVCSGGVRMVWDFLASDSLEPTFVEPIDPRFKGTLIDMAFPLIEATSRQLVIPWEDEGSGIDAHDEESARALKSARCAGNTARPGERRPSGDQAHPVVVSIQPVEDRGKFDSEVLPGIRDAAARARDGDGVLVIDLWNSFEPWASHGKALAHLMAALGSIEPTVRCYVACVDEGLFSMMRQTGGFADLADEVICGFDIKQEGLDTSIQTFWIGLEPSRSKELDELLLRREGFISPDSSLTGVAASHPAWFEKHEPGVGWFVLAGADELRNVAFCTLSNRIKREGASLMMRGVYYLADRYYTKGYLPIRATLQKRGIPGCASLGLAMMLGEIEENAVLFCACPSLSNVIVREFSSYREVIALTSTEKRSLNMEVGERLKDRPVYLVLDMYGGGVTFKDLLEFAELCGADVRKVVAMIDTRTESQELGISYAYESLCSIPIEKWSNIDEAPEDIRKAMAAGLVKVVDPDSGVISHERRIFSLTGSGGMRGLDFWSELCAFGSVTHAHKEYGFGVKVHHPYYIDAALPFTGARSGGSELDRRVVDNVARLLDVVSEGLAGESVQTIVYAEHDETVKIVQGIRDFDFRLKFVPVSRKGNYAIGAGFDGDIFGRHVLILDSGSISGATLRELANQVVRRSPASISYFVVIDRLSENKVAKLLNSEDLPGSYVYGYRTAMPAFRAEVCPICRMRQEYERLADRRDDNSYGSSQALAECDRLVEMLGEMELEADGDMKKYRNRIDFWGFVHSRDLEAVERCLEDTAAGVGAGDEGRDREVAYLFFVLAISAHSNRAVRSKLEKSAELANMAVDRYNACDNADMKFYFLKYLSVCHPAFCMEVIEAELLGMVDKAPVPAADYFRCVDSMRAIMGLYEYRIRRALDLLRGRSPGCEFLALLKYDQWAIPLRDPQLDGAASEKKKTWPLYYGSNGPAHTPIGDAVAGLTRAGLNGEGRMLQETWHNHARDIRAMASRIRTIIPSSDSPEFSVSPEYYARLMRDLAPDKDSRLEVDIAAIDRYLNLDTVDSAEHAEVRRRASDLKSLLYPSMRGGELEVPTEDDSISAYEAVMGSFAPVKVTVQEIVDAMREGRDPEAIDDSHLDAAFDPRTQTRALISSYELKSILRGLIANVFMHNKGATCFVSCDLEANPASVVVEDDGGEKPCLENIEAVIRGEHGGQFLSEITAPERKRHGYGIDFSVSGYGGLRVVVYLELVVGGA